MGRWLGWAGGRMGVSLLYFVFFSVLDFPFAFLYLGLNLFFLSVFDFAFVFCVLDFPFVFFM